MTRTVLALFLCGAICTSVSERAEAQPPAAVATPPANLVQLMRGTLYPESNVVFAAQDTNPADVPHAKDPSMSTDLLTSQYGKWDAVENSALALAEVSNLLLLPGRKCANGLDVPVNNADWSKFVQQLRDAGMAAYTAAQTKNQDKMTDVSGVLTDACKNCHDRYRDRRSFANRCK
jgi:Cytochrome C'